MRVLHTISTYNLQPRNLLGGTLFSVYARINALATLPDLELKVLATNSVCSLLAQRLNV